MNKETELPKTDFSNFSTEKKSFSTTDFYSYVGGSRDTVLSSQNINNLASVNSKEGGIKIRRNRVSNQVITPSKQTSAVIEIKVDKCLVFILEDVGKMGI